MGSYKTEMFGGSPFLHLVLKWYTISTYDTRSSYKAMGEKSNNSVVQKVIINKQWQWLEKRQCLMYFYWMREWTVEQCIDK